MSKGDDSWRQGKPCSQRRSLPPAPEPSTYVAAIGLLALMLWPLRRRLRGKVS